MTVKFCGTKVNHDPHDFLDPGKNGQPAETVECLGWFERSRNPTLLEASAAVVEAIKETEKALRKLSADFEDFSRALREKNND